MSAHTEGPWLAKGASVYGPNSCGFVDCCGIAECFHGSSTEIAEANARLIAAAPDLLWFAKWIAERHDEKSVEGMCARSVIASATDGSP